MAARVIAVCFLVFLSLATSADSLTGKVVKITDGDTLYVLDANYKEHKIRLAGIDANDVADANRVHIIQRLGDAGLAFRNFVEVVLFWCEVEAGHG